MTPQPTLQPKPTRYEMISRLFDGIAMYFPKVTWEEYEELLHQLDERPGIRLSFFEGELAAMSLSFEHEKYARFIDQLITAIKLRLRINILAGGSWTMRKKEKQAGKEPDACFYVQTADAIGNRLNLDFAIDPPPDIAVEVDIHHKTKDQLLIYAALGIPELWVFEKGRLTIHLLDGEEYNEAETSRALPMLTASILTNFLNRLTQEGEFEALLAFDNWLQTLQP
jgi:Uma2 family endonuclease